MNWLKYELHTNTHDAPIIGNILCSMGIDGYEITDHVPLTEKEEKQMYTDIPADMGVDDGSSILTFYTEVPGEGNPDFFSTGSSIRDENLTDENKEVLEPEVLIKRLKKKIKKIKKFTHIKMPQINYSIEDDSQWKDKWKDNFKAFRVADDIIIKPTWEEIPEDASENDTIMQIDPGSAFGTGTHETTQMIVGMLLDMDLKGKRVLDCGCGTGILAITALKCGAADAVAYDIDEWSADNTRHNAEINGVADRIEVFEGNAHVLSHISGVFDVVLANINRNILLNDMPAFREVMAHGGTLILSGFYEEDIPLLVEKAESLGISLKEKKEEGEWRMLVFK